MAPSFSASSPRAVARALLLVASTVLAAPLAAQSGTWVDTGLRVGYQVSSEPVWQTHVDHVACAASTTIQGSCGIGGFTVDLAASTAPGGVMRARTATSAFPSVVTLETVPPPDIRNGFFGASAGTGFWDRATFGSYTPAAIRLSYTLDGTVSISPMLAPTYVSAYGTIGFSATSTPGVPGTWTPLYTDGVIGDTPQSREIHHAGFVDIPLVGDFLEFSIGINTWSDIGGGLPGTLLMGLGLADFSHTARIGIQAIDASGRDVTAASGLTFASGAAYPTSAISAVPEPATVALLAPSVVALAGVAARRRRARG